MTMNKSPLVLILAAVCVFSATAANNRNSRSGRVAKKPRVMIPVPECLNPGKNPAADLEFPIGEKKTVCTSNKGYGKARKADPDAAMRTVYPYLNNACRIGKEQLLYIVQDGKDFTLERLDLDDGNKTETIGYFIKPKDPNLIEAFIHNHPEGVIYWPTEADVKSALENGCNCYIRACDGKLYVFDVTDGNVYEIGTKKWRRGKPLKQYPLTGERTNDGHDLYDLSKYEEMKAMYAPKKVNGGQTPVGEAPRSRSGYCECAKPQILGHGAYVGKLYKSKSKTQHLGQIGFVCMACGRPNKALQEQARAWKASQESEGLPTQWYDFQMQYIENMKK